MTTPITSVYCPHNSVLGLKSAVTGMKTPLDSLINCYNCSRLPTARKKQFATSKTCENVVSIGRDVAYSQEAESWTHVDITSHSLQEMKDVERTFCRSKYEYNH